jgi:predicted TIM-barrel fold metal-dependent hydrolase
MIIDSHCHLGKKNIVATAAQLVASMDDAGIDKSLVLAGKMNEYATEVMLADIEPYKGRLYGVGSVSPVMRSMGYDVSYYRETEHLFNTIETAFKENKIYAVKFYPGYEHYYPNDPILRAYLKICVKYNKPAIFHSGDLYNKFPNAKLKYAHPLHIDDLAVDMPDLKIVIAHIGYPFIREAAEVCYKNKNCYTDTSGFVYGDFTDKDVNNYRKVIEEFMRIAGGTEKLIFGSDWPISNQKPYVSVIRMLLHELDVSKDEIETVMNLRAANLFGIE